MLKSSSRRTRISGGAAGALLTLAGLILVVGCGGGSGGGSLTGNTTGLPTDGSTDGSPTTGNPTTGTIGAGVLPNNVIFYALSTSDDATNVRYIQPNGSGDTAYAALPHNFQGLAINPVSNTQKVFGFRASDSAALGIYSNSSVADAGKTQIVAPSYDSISSIQLSPDGATTYFAAVPAGGSAQYMYKVPTAGGTPVQLDEAEDFNLNPAGTKLVYSKLTGDDFTTEMYVRGVGNSDSATRLTTNNVEDEFAQWSKDGSKLVFSRGDASTGQLHLYTMSPTAGASATQITSGTGSELVPSFNATGSQVSYIEIDTSTDPAVHALYVNNATALNSGKTLVKSDDLLLFSTYWTGANGRSGRNTPIGRLFERLRKNNKAVTTALSATAKK